MKKYLLHILAIVMSISLIGIIVVQIFWINNAIKVKENEYEENAREALENIIKKIERKYQIIFITESLGKYQVKKDTELIVIKSNNNNCLITDSVVLIDTTNTLRLNNKSVSVKQLKSNNKVSFASTKIETTDEGFIYTTMDSVFNDENNIISNITINKEDKLLSHIKIEYDTRNDPIDKRINLIQLDVLIKQEIQEKGLGSIYEYAIINSNNDSIEKKSEGFETKNIPNSIKGRLFPDDIIDKTSFLHLYLPSKSSFIYKSISIILLGSIFFTLVIIVIFFVTIRITFRQKKLSEIKSDFINNMTHEFKTPIATISLAADLIKNSKIINDEQKITHYLNIIKEENRRMNNQVESVLQMSLLEKDKFKINLSEYDLHELIEKAVKNINLKIIEKEGRLSVDLQATKPYVMVDETHFLNVIHNLIDNALKYSDKKPEINLQTTNNNGDFKITIQDKGIGIKKEELVRIFDKFYRVSTGNIHNVKGFGLGLSYVKAIISEFKGTVTASSEFGKGSQFEITLPLIQDGNGK